MKYKIPPSNKWCIIRDNELLRQLLVSKAEDLNMSLVELAHATGLNKYQIGAYFNNTKKNMLTQYGVVKLAKALGYEIKLDISIKIP
jgi:hypothetical protein